MTTTAARQEFPVRTFLRLRPPTQREQERKPCVEVLDGKRIRVAEENSSSAGTEYEWEGVRVCDNARHCFLTFAFTALVDTRRKFHTRTRLSDVL